MRADTVGSGPTRWSGCSDAGHERSQTGARATPTSSGGRPPSERAGNCPYFPFACMYHPPDRVTPSGSPTLLLRRSACPPCPPAPPARQPRPPPNAHGCRRPPTVTRPSTDDGYARPGRTASGAVSPTRASPGRRGCIWHGTEGGGAGSPTWALRAWPTQASGPSAALHRAAGYPGRTPPRRHPHLGTPMTTEQEPRPVPAGGEGVAGARPGWNRRGGRSLHGGPQP